MKDCKNLQIAYIGGGSRGWAWQLMRDLALEKELCGTVKLYDIDYEASKDNEKIGNSIGKINNDISVWKYEACEKIDDALTGSDFVVISILPGTFDEMESDVHTPEKYGIYQSVGDTTGPGGIIRALRTIPMFQTIAKAVERFCPDAWVINYTNPMTVCVKTLYETFPKIKAFGCCHEVFATQKLLAASLEKVLGIKAPSREEIKTTVTGINHFTWLTEAHYKNIDLFPIYEKFVSEYYDEGYTSNEDKNHWMNNVIESCQRVKFDLFKKYGYIAAAGDRHLAEFNPGYIYLKNPQQVKEWKFGLTSVKWRKEDLKRRIEESRQYISKEKTFEIKRSGEEGVKQMKALLGLSELITNVNIPNYGQIPNLPIGAVVETNACFRDDMVTPLFAGNVPEESYPLIARVTGVQELTVKAGINRDLNMAYQAFINDPLVTIPTEESKKLFDEMIENTKKYLGDYDV